MYVIAGPNGAGKTTFASNFLPDFVDCREFLNADLIAAGLSPFAPETQNLRAGRLLLDRIAELARAKVNFGFETTLSGRTYAALLKQLKFQGYRVVLYFLWLPNAELAISRVASRVREGGHNVPPDDIRRRHHAGIRNFFQLYRPIADSWRFYNASRFPPELVAKEEEQVLTVENRRLYRRIERRAESDREERK